MKFRLKLLPLALSAMLASCASEPFHQPSSSQVAEVPAVSTASSLRLRAATPAVATHGASASDQASTVWDRLRDSFAMADCNSDPAVEAWARNFTRDPRRFEGQLEAVLPRLVYVQKVASQYKVPGEFVLIPWVESKFQPVPGRRHRPAGMWQIMPLTAGAMGLRVDGHYDGRMDIPAAANAVMKLLAQYHDQFHDWRVADYAYNAGEYSVRRIVQKHGMPPSQPTIPNWPVKKVTRDHLIKLLGMACVVREPARFHVTLPNLPEEQHLVKVDIPHSMSLARAADHAGMSTDILKGLNSASRDGLLDTEVVSYLMLPASHVEQFADAAKQSVIDGDASGSRRIVDERASTGDSPRVHVVRSGESLWAIARTYHVRVAELKRWNQLSEKPLKPGQRLKIQVNH